MIRIVRDPLPDAVARDLAKYAAKVEAASEQKERATALWKDTTFRRKVRSKLDSTLRRMAPGREYCMYCGDNEGTTVDHFEPVDHNPLRTFDWLNHLLACSRCNSHEKRDQFPRDDKGRPLLIDPTAEDPFEHLRLLLSLGVYEGRTDKGWKTIEVCGLNNDRLVEGRSLAANELMPRLLRMWAKADRLGNESEKAAAVRLVRGQPLADVCQSMLRQAHSRNASELFSPDVLSTLRRKDLQEALYQ